MSFKLLHEAQSKLKNIIHSRFDSAVRCGDAASVERFFKTFPLIGEHKAGLEKFSKYLCTQVTCNEYIVVVVECQLMLTLQLNTKHAMYSVYFSLPVGEF